MPGDVNGDGALNVLDVVWYVRFLNGDLPEGFVMLNADPNGDTFYNITDLALIIDTILGNQ